MGAAKAIEYTAAKPETKRVLVEREIKAILDKHGTISPKLLIEAAKSKEHPLHGEFTWNNAEAATKWRLEQAYRLIQMTRYLPIMREAHDRAPRVIGSLGSVRALLPVGHGDGFKMRADVLSTHDTRKAFLDRKRSELIAWCRGVADVSEFDSLRASILDALKKAQ